MLASRTNYTSADAAMYAGGSEGTERRNARGTRSGISRRRTSKMQSGERYHRSCRCTVRMVAKGDPVAISAADFLTGSPRTFRPPTRGTSAPQACRCRQRRRGNGTKTSLSARGGRV